MNDELKARLTELLEFYREGEYLSEQSLANATPNTIKAIDQAYKDAGYFPPDLTKKLYDTKERWANRAISKMTSQEFLTRFELETQREKQFIPRGIQKLMLEIAKRAAGIE